MKVPPYLSIRNPVFTFMRKPLIEGSYIFPFYRYFSHHRKSHSIIVTMITSVDGAQQKSFYDFTVKTIDGKDLPLSTFKGKKVLVVNVASKCGFTPQYAKLEELYEKYGKDDFVVIGFPANNFLHQEPGTNEEIKEFCTLNY